MKMKRKMQAMFAAMMFVPFSLFSFNCHAEETAKNWEYYASLDDYAVYCEYCQAHGIKAAEALPDRKDLPCYDTYVYRGYVLIDEITVFLDGKMFTDEEEMLHREDASYYGFPKNWIVGDSEALGVDNLGGIVTFEFNRKAPETADIRTNLVNGYRIELTLMNSDFAKDYTVQNIGTILPSEEPAKLGDCSLDGTVDIMDVILVNKFVLGCTKLTEAQQATADVDQNGNVDSTDSLMILKEVVNLTANYVE